MSIDLMSVVWKSQLDSTPKLVLLALADNANDQGVCWPSIGTIMQKTSLGERTVQEHIASLIKLNILRRVTREGRSSYFHINDPRMWCTPHVVHPAPAAPLPPRQPHTPPAPAAPRTIIEPSVETATASRSPELFDQPPTEEAPDASRKPKTKSPRTAGSSRGCAIPSDWQPNENHRAKCGTIATDPDQLAEEFRNYHRARGTIFKDWDAGFHTWITNAAKFSQRNNGNASGNRHGPASVVEAGMRVAARFAGKVGQPV